MVTLQTLWRVVFWFGVVAICGVSVVPQQELPQTGILDKWQHVAAYLVLMAVSYPAYARSGPRTELGIGVGLVVLGAALEVVQGLLPDRVMSFARRNRQRCGGFSCRVRVSDWRSHETIFWTFSWIDHGVCLLPKEYQLWSRGSA